MNKKTEIVILGGDLRFKALAQSLKSRYQTHLFQDEIPSLIQTCDFLILPLPATQGNSTILNFKKNVDLKDIFPQLKSTAYVLAGKVSDEVKNLAKNYNINIFDYYTDEFEMLNAIPSAEGAIEIAMNETDFTLCGSNIFVLGFGRIGKILAKMLSGIGAVVTVCARRKESLALAKGLGFKTCDLKNLAKLINRADLVFNTIPALILDQSTLENTSKNALIIDLASNPGGVDFDYAKKIGIRTIHALGLPAKTSPETSSQILCDCINSFIAERRTNGA